MANSKNALLKLIKRCQKSPSFFIDNFCKCKHPKLGIIPFKLFSYQKKALVEFKKNRYNIFKKCRQCFVSGSMVWTPTGPVSIEKLKPGDEVYTFNSITKNLEIVNIDDVYDNGISKNLVEVRSKTGHRSISTSDHRYLVGEEWVEASDLNQNDRLVEVYDNPRYGRPQNQSDPILLGYLLTDGHCGQNNLYFSNSRWKYLLEFQKNYELRFGRKLKIKRACSGFKPDSKINFRISSSYYDSQLWLEQYGLRGSVGLEKEIPKEVFGWDNESIAVLLNRMFAGDGWYSGSHCNEAGIGQQSIKVLHQIKQLLSRFQISCKIYETEKPNEVHKLRIFGSRDFERFVDQIGIFGKTPKCEITKGFFRNRQKGDVKSVKPVKEEAKVYDLSVPPHHNYVVDGAVVHNCGVSTLTGAYALWYAMFFANKSILIVSKRDEDAMEFLNKNVKFVYENLPGWMKEIWSCTKKNEHVFELSNGSSIRSLTSSPDTLRSNSGSLIIIDEAAFMQHMDTMWAGGWPTIQTGGSVIVISTTNGIGNWYWKTWTDAINNDNDFNTINIDWWDMDWEIKFTDELSGKNVKISPCADVRKCETDKEKETYGPYWSPWLENQYRQLATKGSDHKFRQEILAEFMGTGNTVLNRAALMAIGDMVEETEKAIKDGLIKESTLRTVDYVSPMNGEADVLDFKEEFTIWKPPYTQKDADETIRQARETGTYHELTEAEKRPHMYVIGADPSSGEANDFCGVEIIDITTKEQVAEIRTKALPRTFAKMVDFVGRWYNTAFVVPERTGIGQSFCQELDNELGYPNLYRHKKIGANLKVRYSQIGYPTGSQSKAVLIKHLQDELGEDGYHIKSPRLYHELCIFIHLGKNRWGNETGVGNTDDLTMSLALALVGVEDAIYQGSVSLMPVHSIDVGPNLTPKAVVEKVGAMARIGGKSVLPPYNVSSEMYTGKPDREAELAKFTSQLGGLPLYTDTQLPKSKDATKDSVSFKKHILRFHKK